VLHRGAIRWFDSNSSAPVDETADATGLAVTAIGSWNDGHSVVLAASPSRLSACRGVIRLQTISSPTRIADRELSHVHRVPGRVDDIAVSADHRRLAMALGVADHPGAACDKVELLTVNLLTGARRVWTLPYVDDPASDAYDEYFLTALAWSPDDRHLAMNYGQCCASASDTWILDTSGRTGELISRLRKVPKSLCTDVAYAWTDAGLISDEGVQPCGGIFSRIVAINPATGKVTRLSKARLRGNISAVVPDATGHDWLVYADQGLFRVNADTANYLHRLNWDTNSPPQAAW
jgi:hypothetical protein